MKSETLDSRQVRLLFFAALLGDALIVPFDSQRFSAWVTVWASLISFAVLAIVAAFLFYRTGVEGRRKYFSGIAFVALLLESAGAFLDAERFYRFCSDKPMPTMIALAAFALIAFYAVGCGERALSRAAGVLLWLLLLSLLAMLLGGVSKMQLVNLGTSWEHTGSIWEACAAQMRFPTALLIPAACAEEKSVKAVQTNPGLWYKKVIFPGLACYTALQIACAVFSELVFGEGALLQMQPMYSLAQQGGISIFRRLDAAHVSIWILAMLLRGTVLFCCAHRCFVRLLPMQRSGVVCFILLGGTMAATVSMSFLVRSILTTLLALIAAVCLYPTDEAFLGTGRERRQTQ